MSWSHHAPDVRQHGTRRHHQEDDGGVRRGKRCHCNKHFLVFFRIFWPIHISTPANLVETYFELIFPLDVPIFLDIFLQGPHCTGNWKKKLSGKTQGIWKFCQNTGNLVCSSFKFPNSKKTENSDICHKIFLSFL